MITLSAKETQLVSCGIEIELLDSNVVSPALVGMVVMIPLVFLTLHSAYPHINAISCSNLMRGAILSTVVAGTTYYIFTSFMAVADIYA